MLKIIRNFVVLAAGTASLLLLSACSTFSARPDNEMTNLYQHRWINTDSPHNVLTINSVAKYLSDYDVVFFGELHAHPGVHLAQMQLFEAMYRLNPRLSLSLEQFERDTQNYIDDYLAGTIGEKYLIKKSRAWENYPTSIRPLVELLNKINYPLLRPMHQKDPWSVSGAWGWSSWTHYQLRIDHISPKTSIFLMELIEDSLCHSSPITHLMAASQTVK